MRAAFWLLIVACVGQIAMAQSDAVVGDFDDRQHLAIEPAATFSPEKIKDRLLLIPEFHLGSDSTLSLDNYLLTIGRLIGAGYRYAGFRDVEVKATPDKKSHTITVQ